MTSIDCYNNPTCALSQMLIRPIGPHQRCEVRSDEDSPEMALLSNDPPAQIDTTQDSDSPDNGFEMTDEGPRRLTEQLDRASREEFTRLEEEVRSSGAELLLCFGEMPG